ncbi:MAG: alpha/beta hydrolase, partial [Spirochaetales bacterium]|nr:alpha/beta hydrolase [Spirochaetales bacterium]
GAVRIPAHLSKGTTVRVRCSRCRTLVPLSLGRFFPQGHSSGYRALIPDSLGCRGTSVGRLWIETAGRREDSTPVVVFPAHPSLSHEVMHDLMDPFGEQFRICYLEFPGTQRNTKELENKSYASIFCEHIDLLRVHLRVLRFHLLSHLDSASLVLEAASRHPGSVASVILIEPNLRQREPVCGGRIHGKLDRAIPRMNRETNRKKLLEWMLRKSWDSKLPRPHGEGLAAILCPSFQPANLRHKLVESPGTWRYGTLKRLKVPVLIVHSLDGSESSRRDALYLRSTLPVVETAAVDRGGPWASWLRRTVIGRRLPAFKAAAEKTPGEVRRKSSRTLNGQPLGWMILVFALLAAGLTLGFGWLRFQPNYMARVIPALLSGLLPILWFVVPREINPFVFLRFRRLSIRTVALSLLIGALLALFYRSLLLTLVRVSLPVHPPRAVLSIAPGGGGRLLELAGVAVVALFVFGVAGNLLVMRRSGLQVLLPALLFTLLPPGFPDVLWKLPMGFASAVLFAAGVSIYAPLFVLAAFAAVCELAVPIDRLPIYWQSAQGVAATVAVLAAAILLAVTVGTRGKPNPPERVYFSGTNHADAGLFRWRRSLSIVLAFTSLVGSIGFIFYFLDF